VTSSKLIGVFGQWFLSCLAHKKLLMTRMYCWRSVFTGSIATLWATMYCTP